MTINTLSTITDSEGNHGVKDSEGGVWWPTDAAQAEIQASADPEQAALEMCETSPKRGEWFN